MSKIHFTICVAAAALLATPVLAQTSTQTRPASPPPAVPNTTTGSGGSATMSANSFITQREPGVFRASELIGMDVRGANNEDIGEVGDVLIDRSGQARAVVIDVGGFLGIGETHVAIPMQSLQFRSGQQNASAAGSTGAPANANNPSTTGATGQSSAAQSSTNQNRATSTTANAMPDVIVLVMTKEQLQNAPKFRDDSNRESGSTTGSTSGSTGAGTNAPRQ